MREGGCDNMKTDCQPTVELLPWWLNGSLDADERRSVETHLASCADCRRELASTKDAWMVLTQHIPSMSLAEYAQGLPQSDLDRVALERHLACCASCRQELEWASSDRVLAFEPRREKRNSVLVPAGHLRLWRRLAVAASLIAVLSLSAWLRVREGQLRGDAPARAAQLVPAERADGQQQNDGESIKYGLFADGFESGDSAAWSAFQADTPLDTSSKGDGTGSFL